MTHNLRAARRPLIRAHASSRKAPHFGAEAEATPTRLEPLLLCVASEHRPQAPIHQEVCAHLPAQHAARVGNLRERAAALEPAAVAVSGHAQVDGRVPAGAPHLNELSHVPLRAEAAEEAGER